MQSPGGTSRTPLTVHPTEGSWVQITFTLDPVHYRMLWERAETEHRTLSSLVRDRVIDLLEEARSASRKIKACAK